VLWGALPLTYSDGTVVDYPRSASTSADWTYWNVKDQTAFTELDYAFDNGWRPRDGHLQALRTRTPSCSTPTTIPTRSPAWASSGMSGIYPSKLRELHPGRLRLGPVPAVRPRAPTGGRRPDLQVHRQGVRELLGDTILYPAVGLGPSRSPSRPIRAPIWLGPDRPPVALLRRRPPQRHRPAQGRGRLQRPELKSKGYSYGTDTPRDEKKVSPYVGAVYDLTPNVSLYASYTDIFNPQSDVDINHQNLPAAHGEAYEAGVKSEWFDHRLYATARCSSPSRTTWPSSPARSTGRQELLCRPRHRGDGLRAGASGALTDQWTVSAGWTQLKVEGEDGHVATYLPRKTFKASTTYSFPALRNLTVGAACAGRATSRWSTSRRSSRRPTASST
jgi:outer membrane receptor for ferric coprogen and ferric-rhodotorulic acid